MRFWSSTPPSQRSDSSVPESDFQSNKRTRRFWELLVAILVAIIVGVLFALSVTWPYSQKKITASIQRTFDADVRVGEFRQVYFPHPGCEVKFVTLTRPQNSHTATTTVTVERILITGAYTDLVFHPHRLEEIQLNGLHVKISTASESEVEGNTHARRQPNSRPHSQPEAADPPSSQNQDSQDSHASNSMQSKLSVGTISTIGAVLEIESGNAKTPVKFEIHKLTLEHIAAREPMNYRLIMGIPDPPGELESRGTLGPWQSATAKLPLHGVVHLTGAKLDKYPGIGGTIDSSERFNGTLDSLDVTGEATVADFVLKSAKHPVRLHANFQATIDAMEGEARIRQADVHVGHTTARFQASVGKNPRDGHRLTKVDFSVQHGRAEDMLWLFNHRPRPPMTGEATCSGHAVAPEFGQPFLKGLQVKGRFDVRDGRFEPGAQSKTNVLSARAQGKKVKNPDDAPPAPVEQLSSDVVIQQAVAHFSGLDFEVPGASAKMHGTFNFLDDQVNLHGDLRTDAPISKDTSGIKSVLLKPLDPFFHKKNAGAQVPVVMDGPISSPHFATDIIKKK